MSADNALKQSLFIRQFYSGDTLAEIDALADKAAAGAPGDAFALGKRMIELISPYMAPDDVPIYKDALRLFEQAGAQGHVESMEYAVQLYAAGRTNQQVVEEGNVITVTPLPDWQKAYDWCVKAKDAGGKWATEIFPRLTKCKANSESIALLKPIALKRPAP